jgi:hypothetical protein
LKIGEQHTFQTSTAQTIQVYGRENIQKLISSAPCIPYFASKIHVSEPADTFEKNDNGGYRSCRPVF